MRKMRVADEMREKLEAAFTPSALEIRDDSERHRGHAGYQEGGESHFHITISAQAFKSMSRIARHRAIHQALGAELVARIHALSMTVSD